MRGRFTLEPRALYTAFANHEALTSVFGCWPSFAGAELIALRLDTKDGIASLEADIRLDRGLATLRFEYVDDLELEDWEHRNVLEELEIEYDEDDKRFEVEFSADDGCAAEFDCVRISVVSARPRER